MGGIVSYCFFCGSPGPAGTPCGSCLVTIPRPAPEVASSFTCPRCTTPLTPIGIAPSATIHACVACHGMFVGARAWCTIVQRPELARAIASKLPPRDAPRSGLVGLLRCPACAREMERGRFGASSSVVIDVCVAHGQWLDAGEVVAVADHAAFRARVGIKEARRAAEAADGYGSEALRSAAAEAESTMRLAAASARSQKVKRGGLLFLLALAAVRITFFFVAGGSKAPAQITNASESAGSAASALQQSR